MMALPYIFSFITGALLLQRVLKHPRELSALFVPLAFGLGLGVSSLLTFYSLLIWNKFYLPGIFILHILTWAILMFKKNTRPAWPLREFKEFCTFAVSLWPVWFTAIIAFQLLYTLAQYHPFGEWDAWAVWNLKTKFIVEAGENWKNIFRLHWHTQPDYPWLLPCLNAWAAGSASVPVHKAGQVTAVLLSVNTVLLLQAALQRYIKYPLAVLASALLATCPTFTFLGTSQYADIVLAHYLLMAVICMVIFLRENHSDLIPILGFTLGLLTFAKNEGILLTLIIAGVLTQKLVRQKSMLKNLFTSFFLTACAAVIFKLFLAPPNRDVAFAQITLLPSLFSLERCGLILKHYVSSLLDWQWHFIWLLLAGFFFWDIKRWKSKENLALLISFVLYCAAIFVIYLCDDHFDLAWRLSRTVSRILFYLLPSCIFMAFYTHRQKN